MDIDDILKILKRMSPLALIALIYVLFVTNVVLYFIPIILWFFAYLMGRMFSDSNAIATIIGFAISTFIMSFISLLVYYFPNSIGSGLFADGFKLASVITISNGIELLFYAQTIEWGIIFDWIVVIGGIIGIIVYFINYNH